MDNLLQQAMSAIKAGDWDSGRRVLVKILNTDPDNETAWLWLAAAVEGDRRRHCLEQVLRINPNSQAAQKGLEELAGTSTAPAGVEADMQPTPADDAVPSPEISTEEPADVEADTQ